MIQIECKECGGDGIVYADCACCQGTGEGLYGRDCPVCRGSGGGYIDCPECLGTGYVDDEKIEEGE